MQSVAKGGLSMHQAQGTGDTALAEDPSSQSLRQAAPSCLQLQLLGDPMLLTSHMPPEFTCTHPYTDANTDTAIFKKIILS